MKRLLVAILSVGALSLAACDVPAVPTENANKITQSQKAAQAASEIQFSANAEIENIKRRLELTSNPGQIGFIILLNEMGQPVMYSSVKGKITSGSKRLTSPESVVSTDCGEYHCDQIRIAPSDEGTFGSSDPYIFWWDANGAYHQWNGKYLYSDKPFRITQTPLVVTAIPETK